MTAKKSRQSSHPLTYRSFEQLNGVHPWQVAVPEGLILYPVRQLKSGRVSYINFELAREMGLLPPDHPDELNASLEQKILETFCLRIINEYDQQNKLRFNRQQLKPQSYMATRYLQLQHSDKAGRTSGDGRCIWNGVVVNKNGVWDVSSRGTGVTALAPGVVKAGQPLKSGNNDHGYGCGMAEIDELFGAAILAEIFHRNAIPTERVLAIVDLGKGVGIGVRAAQNLIRPAHLFLFLKQNKRQPLIRALDYLIDRQYQNKRWSIKRTDQYAYDRALQEIAKAFASFVAQLDRDYIFAWLDWDGDNVLADAGIIDYGSVRQFGLRHDQYRYDDVERMSTNLSEQKLKAREIVQTFAQAIDFAKTGQRKPWPSFRKSQAVKLFDQEFEKACLERFLFQVGFPEAHRRLLLNHHSRDVKKFFLLHCEFERFKTQRKLHKVADGVHRPAIFNMRSALSEMPKHLMGLPLEWSEPVESQEFLHWILSSRATKKDQRMAKAWKSKIKLWQKLYIVLVYKIAGPVNFEKTVELISKRAHKINFSGRITGNALIHIVDEILRHRRKGLSDREIQKAIDQLIAEQTLNPDRVSLSRKANEPTPDQLLLRSFLTVVHGYREDI